MKRRRRPGALALGAATFVAVLTLSVAAVPGEEAEAVQPAPAPAAALARIGEMNERAATVAASRRRATSAVAASTGDPS